MIAVRNCNEYSTPSTPLVLVASISHNSQPKNFSASDQGMSENMDAYLDCAVSTMKDFGGPSLDKEVLRMQFTLTALQQMCLDAMVMV